MLGVMKFPDKGARMCSKCGEKPGMWHLRAHQHFVCEDCRKAIEWRDPTKHDPRTGKAMLHD
jgi:Fe2+ or Zn2+ uptake regulation protein